jgi:hypothetical protein
LGTTGRTVAACAPTALGRILLAVPFTGWLAACQLAIYSVVLMNKMIPPCNLLDAYAAVVPISNETLDLGSLRAHVNRRLVVQQLICRPFCDDTAEAATHGQVLPQKRRP